MLQHKVSDVKRFSGCLLDYGLSVIPTLLESKKTPKKFLWRPYMKKLPELSQYQAWFENGLNYCPAIVCGAVSGNLEILDFDIQAEFFEAWKSLISQDLFDKLVIETSQNGGRHVIYRCQDTVRSFQKLAYKLIEVAGPGEFDIYNKKIKSKKIGNAYFCATIAIETRGEGSYCLCYPSPKYELIQNDFSKIPVLSSEEHEILIQAALSFNQYFEIQPDPIIENQISGGGVTPWEDFNNQTNPIEMLLDYGWQKTNHFGHCQNGKPTELLIRPGKKKGVGGSVIDSRLFYCFSSNAIPFEEGKAYKPAVVYALLKHNGDFKESAKNLYRQGFGDRIEKKKLETPVSVETVKRADLKKESDISLVIPKELYQNQGLISLGIDAAVNEGTSEIIQYQLSVIYALIARTIANKLSCQKVWPNLYNVKVGGTSTGKTEVDQVFNRALTKAGIEKFYGPTDFSSGPALLREMQEGETPQCLISLDEVSFLFKRSKDDLINQGITKELLQLYTCAGLERTRPYSDASKNIKILNPCLILTGNATTDIFGNLKIEDLISGLIQRFDFFTYDGKIPYRKPAAYKNSAMDKFVSGLINIFKTFRPAQSSSDIAAAINACYDLSLTPDCENLLLEYSIKVIDSANEHKPDGEGIQGIISRNYHLAIKYAMIHRAATQPASELFNPLETKNLEYGIAVAGMLSEWKIKVLNKKITAGDFHKICETFKEAIEMAIRAGKQPTQKALCSRKKKLAELKPKDWQDVVSVLTERGEIIIEQSDYKDKTIYQLVK